MALLAALLAWPGAPLLALPHAHGGDRQQPSVRVEPVAAPQYPFGGMAESGRFRWSAADGLERAAQNLLPQVEEILDEARAWTGLEPDERPFDLELVASREDLARALGEESVPEWYAAVAVPAQRRLILATEPAGGIQQLRLTLRHELMHLAMADMGLEAFRRIPAWFHEGCAEDFAGDVYLGRVGVSLSWLAWTNNLERLSTFEDGFGKDTLRAAVGYALGHAFVERLVLSHGRGIVPRLLAHIAQGHSLDKALLIETGLSLVTHEEQMRSWLSSPIALIQDIYPHLFLLLVLLMVAMFPLARLRRKKRLQELEQKWEHQEMQAMHAETGSEPEEAPHP